MTKCSIFTNHVSLLGNRYGPLLTQLKEMQLKLHSPPCWKDTEVLITNGSQDGLCKAFEMMMNFNDHVIVQEPVYAGTLAIVRHVHSNRWKLH